jgi:membrane protein implicated in regulation of membrane protease activity
MIATVGGLLVGILCGVFASADGKHPIVGLGYGLLVIATGVFLLVASTAVFTGVFMLAGVLPYALVCIASMCVAYFLSFFVARRFRSRFPAPPSKNAT